MPINDYNEVFDDPTSPRSDAAKDAGPGAEKPADERQAAGGNGRSPKPPRAPKRGEAPPEMSAEELGQWRWQLGATARKSAAAQQRARDTARAWERVVAQARNAGVPERLLMAAALEADVDLPAGE